MLREARLKNDNRSKQQEVMEKIGDVAALRNESQNTLQQPCRRCRVLPTTKERMWLEPCSDFPQLSCPTQPLGQCHDRFAHRRGLQQRQKVTWEVTRKSRLSAELGRTPPGGATNSCQQEQLKKERHYP